MYNGIGLSTPRGSGTNGYVQRNFAFVKRRLEKPVHFTPNFDEPPPPAREPDKDILAHDRKRTIEVECMKLRLNLEDDGIEPDDIEIKVQELRDNLMAQIDSIGPRKAKELHVHESHQLLAAKKEENKKMMNALRIKHDHVEGKAFDNINGTQPEAQEEGEQVEEKEHRRRDRDRDEEVKEKEHRRRDRDRDEERSKRHDRDDREYSRRRRYRSRSRSKSRDSNDNEDERDHRRDHERNRRRHRDDDREYSRKRRHDSRDSEERYHKRSNKR